MLSSGRDGFQRISDESPSISSDERDLPAKHHHGCKDQLTLLSAFLCMVAIGHCQYTWTLFVEPLAAALTVSAAEIQIGFTLFVTLQTTSVLVLGLLAPPNRQHEAIALGAACLLASLHMMSTASSLLMLYASTTLMGIGVGSVYSVSMATSVSVYPEHRGLAAGIVAAGYGAGTLPTIALIENHLQSTGYAATLQALGYGLSGLLLLAVALRPRIALGDRGEGNGKGSGEGGGSCRESGTRSGDGSSCAGSIESDAEVPLRVAVCRGSFWTLYVMLVLISFVGLVVSAQLRPIASYYSIAPSTVVGALQLDRLLNGISRPLWGLLSDTIGRERALGAAFAVNALVLLGWSRALAHFARLVESPSLPKY